VLIELFSLGVTAEALRVIICTKLACVFQHVTTHSGWTHIITTTEFGIRELVTSLLCEPFRHGSQVWWMDRTAISSGEV